MDRTLETGVVGDGLLRKKDRNFPHDKGQYVGVIGTIINSMIVRAQIHGGLAQGIGPALSESETYKVDSGQILARSFLDYGIPRTDDLIDATTQTAYRFFGLDLQNASAMPDDI